MPRGQHQLPGVGQGEAMPILGQLDLEKVQGPAHQLDYYQSMIFLGFLGSGFSRLSTWVSMIIFHVLYDDENVEEEDALEEDYAL